MTAPSLTPPAQPPRLGLLWPSVLAVAGLAVLIGLGTWQMQRRAWKDAIVARMAAERAAPPVDATAIWPDLPCRAAAAAPRSAASTDPDACEYQRVRLVGTFDHARERHIFTATPKFTASAETPALPGAGPGGFWVMTPLVLANGRLAYVNRGFVPEGLKDPARRREGQVAGPVEVVGLTRTAQRRATFDGADDPARNIWYVRDPAALWAGGPAAGVDPSAALYLDMTGPSPAGGLPRPLAAQVVLSNRHLEYALTWYGLAVTLLAVYGAFAWTRLSAARLGPR